MEVNQATQPTPLGIPMVAEAVVVDIVVAAGGSPLGVEEVERQEGSTPMYDRFFFEILRWLDIVLLTMLPFFVLQNEQ